MPFHRDQILDDNHAVIAREYVNLAARDADTDFNAVTTNLNKLVRVDPGTIYMLIDESPAVWVTFMQGGDVVGPGSSTNNALMRWDGLSGQAAQDSVAILSDAGALSGLTQIGLADDAPIVLGDAGSITLEEVSGNLVIENSETGRNIVIQLGSDNSNTLFLVENASADDLLHVFGDGEVAIPTGNLEVGLGGISSPQGIDLSLNTGPAGAASAGTISISASGSIGLTGGNLILEAGDGFSLGGFVSITAGNRTGVTGVGRDVTITAGRGFDNSDGGVVRIDGGPLIGSAAKGAVVLQDGGGKVGIGVLAPDSELHVRTGSAGAVTAIPGTIITAEGVAGGNAFISILSDDLGSRGILFGDPSSPTDASIIYNDNGADALEFIVNGLEALLIEGSNVGVRDGVSFSVGNDTDAVFFHNGTNTLLTNSTGELRILNAGDGDFLIHSFNPARKLVNKLGSGDAATAFEVHDNNDAVLMRIEGSGNVGFGTPTPDASSLLEISSTAQGFLPPRMTEAQRDAIVSAATGLTIYNTDDLQLEVYNGTDWKKPAPEEPLAATLALGNDTGGNDIEMSVGDSIVSSESVTVKHTDDVHSLGTWATQASAADNTWLRVAFGNGIFIAISGIATDQIMRSTDNGETWSLVSTPLDGSTLQGIAFGGGSFVVVAFGNGKIMESTDDGLTWTQRASPSDNQWRAVAYSETTGRFVMVNAAGVDPKSAYSDDLGVTWTLGQTSGGGGLPNALWNDITWGDFSGGRFVAVANDSGNRAWYSADGDTWTGSTTQPSGTLQSVAFGNGTFVAVDNDGVAVGSVNTSSDGGVTWVDRTAASANQWEFVAFGNGIFVAVSDNGTGDRSMFSIDNGVTWTTIATPADNEWFGIAFGNGTFVAVADTGTGDRVMTVPITGSEIAVLDMQSTTSGFLPPRLFDANRDLISNPDSGLSIFNMQLGHPEHFNPLTNNWSAGASGASRAIYVRSIADLPTPVSTVITLADNVCYVPLESFDLEGNTIVFGDDTNWFNANNIPGIVISGTSSTTLISNTAAGGMDMQGIDFVQNGTGDLISSSLGNVNLRSCGFSGGAVSISASTGAIFFRTSFTSGASLVLPSPGLDFILIEESFFQDSADGDILINITGADVGATGIRSSIFVQVFASVAVDIANGAVIDGLFEFQAAQISFNAGAIGFRVENPDDIESGEIITSGFSATGTKIKCEPVSSSDFASPGTTPGTPKGVAIDGDGNLLIADSTEDIIYRMVGMTNVVDTSIVAPDVFISGIVWAKGNLISCDPGTNLIYVHDGFSTTITTSFATPAGAISRLTFDGTNLISTDSITGLIYVHDGISATVTATANPTLTALEGIAFDGVNLIATDRTDDEVHVLEGISGVPQYDFETNEAPDDIVVTPTGFVFCDSLLNRIFLYNHPVTFDHSARTWEIKNTLRLIESSDRGGSQFTDPAGTGISIAVTQNIWTDIAATDLFYGSFNANEKTRLNDETNGEVIWTGPRESGHQVSALATITRGGSNADRVYEVAVVINGFVQTDSISSNVLPDTSTFATIQTLPITRILKEDDTIKVQIRNVTDTESPLAISAKLSIN